MKTPTNFSFRIGNRGTFTAQRASTRCSATRLPIREALRRVKVLTQMPIRRRLKRIVEPVDVLPA